jgi:Fe-S-cluster-containing hydrogenase component 2
MMEWTKEAEESVQNLPLPPMLSSYARLECERLAKKKGLTQVTPEIVAEADKRYELAIGRDVMRKLRDMASGKGDGVVIPEEFFDDEAEELFTIEMCPSKYGAASDIKIDNMKRLIPALREKLKELKITDLMLDLTTTAVMPHCEFRVHVAGCTNACLSPYFSDFGILGSYDVELVPEKCTGCEKCVNYCSIGAITMKDTLPAFDKSICIRCAGCEEFCPESAIAVNEMGYKVVVGGSGARHPKIAETVTEFTDLRGVLTILENTVSLIRNKSRQPMRVFTLRKLIEELGGVKSTLDSC